LIKSFAAGIQTELVACGLWWSLWCFYWYSFRVRSWLTPFLYMFVQGLMYDSSLHHNTESVICNLAKVTSRWMFHCLTWLPYMQKCYDQL